MIFLGSVPKVWAKKEVNKPEFSNNNFDILGSGPRMLHVGLNKPEFNLTNRDIDRSWPKWNKFDTTRESSNPLNPVYKLAYVEYVKPEAPKFIRDAMGVSDLEGAKPKKEKVLKTRETNKVGDIEGASPKVRKHRKMFEAYSNLNYNDVTRDLRKS